MPHWTEQAHTLYQDGCDSVQVSVVKLQGSGPRAAGSRMIVTAEQIFFSIGGGNLEMQAIEQARQLLDQRQADPLLEEFALGASRGQCCGGRVTLLFEPVLLPQQSLLLLGGGHVAQALAPLLAAMPIRFQWVDSRAQMHIDPQPGCELQADLSDSVSEMPAQSLYLIMTHDHRLDLTLCEHILQRNDARFLGVIGSRSKAARFRHQLHNRGFSTAQIDTLNCPVGLPGIEGKRPVEIAVAVAAQIMKLYQTTHNESSLQAITQP